MRPKNTQLSKDDGMNNESMSISTHKTMLEYYVKRNGFLNCQFYVDDGLTDKNNNTIIPHIIICFLNHNKFSILYNCINNIYIILTIYQSYCNLSFPIFLFTQRLYYFGITRCKIPMY